ncbi:MAG: DUF3298 domain-containing protein [Bacteroidales bacterium]|nr:DUF3298 domain-containing protein [Bacteroidales bacterium]
MKRFLHILTAAVATLLLLAGCNRGIHTATASHSGSTPLSEGSEIAYSYSYSMEYLTGGLPQEVVDRINATIIRRDILFAEEDFGSDIRAACRQWEESGIAAYLTDAGEMMDEFDGEDSYMFNWESGIDGSFLHYDKSRRLLTYRCCSNDYMGGAHGMYGESYTVFDTETGAVVTEDDLFDGDWEEALGGLLADRALEEYADLAEEEGVDIDDIFFAGPYPNGNFSVEKDGITWHYNPYDIAPYAFGVIEVTLGWKELAPLMSR